MHRFTCKAKVYLGSYSCHDAVSVQEATDIKDMAVWPEAWAPLADMTQIGVADVTVTIASREQITENKVAALQAELAQKRAEAAAEFIRIEDQISKLQALTYEAPEAA